jgi:hypothetical protein
VVARAGGEVGIGFENCIDDSLGDRRELLAHTPNLPVPAGPVAVDALEARA